jgi:hypothetical protein
VDEAEERAEFVDEQFGLLEGGEVTALAGLAPVADVGEALLGPSPGRAGIRAWCRSPLRADT